MSITAERLAGLPTGPGCYLFKDAAGTDIYVGKAKNLRRRVTSYFRDREGHPARTTRLVQETDDLDWIPTGSEIEALILESRLIKELQPRWNVKLKDGKDYPLLAITREDFPRVFITRDRDRDGIQLYGPFGSATDLRRAFNFLQRVFQFRICSRDIQADDERRRFNRPCLNYHIKRCSGPCAAKVGKAAYGEDLAALRAFLSGRGRKPVVDALKTRMAEAAAGLRYEEAARCRDQIRALERLSERGNLRDFDDAAAPVVDTAAGLAALAKALDLGHLPRLIEAFDIAHLAGTHVVASLVQFVDGAPNRDAYRRFRVRGAAGDLDPGNDDVGAMREVVARRYRRVKDEGGRIPDLVLVDGGAGQVAAAIEALEACEVPVPMLVGLAKAEEILVRSDGVEIRLPHRDPGLKLLMFARDEAHRFCRRYLHLLQRKDLAD